MSRDFLHCCFCSSTDLKESYQRQPHPVFPAIGYFTIYQCNKCRSLITYPVPSNEQLALLYNSFDGGGIQKHLQQFRSESPLNALYTQSIRRAVRRMPETIKDNSEFTWLDVGAGDGILSAILAEKYPNANGIAVDFHPRPERLNGFKSVRWIQADLNTDNLNTMIPLKCIDLTISLAVLEHVQDPSKLIRSLLPLAAKNGIIYIACPASDSIAGRVMGRKWPYFIPGEHINIPSKKGCRSMFQKLIAEQPDTDFTVSVKSILVPYPIRYLLNFFGGTAIAKMVSPRVTLPVPSGVLEATAICLK